MRNVPIARTETVKQNFAIRFVSSAGVLGDLTPFSVVFDETFPKAVSTTRSGQVATVNFAEPVLGSNAAINWNVFESVEDEQGGTTRAFRGVNSVAGAGASRQINADFTANPYGGALYNLLEDSALVYEDYAGNDLATTTQVLAS